MRLNREPGSGDGNTLPNASAAKSLSGDQVVKQFISLLCVAVQLIGYKC